MKRSVRLFWLIFLLFPFVEIGVRLSRQLKPLDLDFLQLSKYLSLSVLQAGLSTFFIMGFGLLISLGLFQRTPNFSLRLLLATPAFVPTVFILTSVFGWSLQFGFVLRSGLTTVVGLHVLMNCGLASILLSDLFRYRMEQQWELAFVEGASRFQLLKESISALRAEIAIIAAGFFSFCFTSFSIPLIVGGATGKTLEVFAFEQLALRSDLQGAVFTGFVQMVVFALLFSFVRSESLFTRFQPRFRMVNSDLSFYQIPFLAACAGAILFVLVFLGMAFDIPAGWRQLNSNAAAAEKFFEVIGATAFLALSTGVAAVVLIALSIAFVDYGWIRKSLLRYGAISVALLGIGLFLMQMPTSLKLLYGFSLLYIPAAYRFYGAQICEGLFLQYEVSRSLGASRWLTFTEVLLPQALPQIFRLSGLVAVWSAGDFALSSVITGKVSTLALFLKSVLSSYRVELASFLCFSLLLVSAAIYLFFEGCSYVSRQRLRT